MPKPLTSSPLIWLSPPHTSVAATISLHGHMPTYSPSLPTTDELPVKVGISHRNCESQTLSPNLVGVREDAMKE